MESLVLGTGPITPRQAVNRRDSMLKSTGKRAPLAQTGPNMRTPFRDQSNYRTQDASSIAQKLMENGAQPPSPGSPTDDAVARLQNIMQQNEQFSQMVADLQGQLREQSEQAEAVRQQNEQLVSQLETQALLSKSGRSPPVGAAFNSNPATPMRVSLHGSRSGSPSTPMAGNGASPGQQQHGASSASPARLESMRISNEILREELSAMERRLKLAEEAARDDQSQLAERDAQLEQARKAAKAQHRELKVELNQARERCANLGAQLASAQAQVKHHTQSQEGKTQIKAEQLQKQLAQARAQAQAAQARLTGAEAQAKAAMADAAEARSACKAAQEQAEQAQAEARNTQADLRRVYKQNKQERDELERKYQAADYEQAYAQAVADRQVAERRAEAALGLAHELVQLGPMEAQFDSALEQAVALVSERASQAFSEAQAERRAADQQSQLSELSVQHQQQMADLQQELSEREQALAQAQATLQEVQTELAQARACSDELAEQCDQLSAASQRDKAKLSQLETDYDHQLAQMAELESRERVAAAASEAATRQAAEAGAAAGEARAALEDALDTLSREKDRRIIAENEADEARDERQVVLSTLDGAQSRANQAESARARLENECNALKERVQQAEERVHQLTSDEQRLRLETGEQAEYAAAERSIHQEAIRELEQQVDHLTDQLHTVQAEAKARSHMLEKAAEKAQKIADVALRREIDQKLLLKLTVVEAKEALFQAQGQRDELIQRAQARDQIDDEIRENFEAQLNELNESNVRLEEKLQSMRKQEQAQRQALLELEEKAQAESERLQNVAEVKEMELQRAEEMLADARHEKNEAVQEKEGLLSALEDQRERLAFLEEERDQYLANHTVITSKLNEQIVSQSLQLDDATMELEQAQQRCAKLRQTVDQLRQEKMQIQANRHQSSSSSSSSSSNENAEQLAGELRAMLTASREQVARLEAQLNAAESQAEQLKDEVDEGEKKMAEVDAEFQKLQAAAGLAQKEKEQLATQLDILMLEIDRGVAPEAQERMRLMGEKMALEREKSAIVSQLEKSNEENVTLNSDFETLRQYCVNYKEKAAGKLAAQQQQIQYLAQQRASLIGQLKELALDGGRIEEMLQLMDKVENGEMQPEEE